MMRVGQGVLAPGVVVAAFVCLGLVYSLVVPLFETPDEPAHFEYTRYLVRERTLPTEARPGYPGYIQTAGHAPLYYLLGAALTGWIDTSDYDNPTWLRNPHFEFGPDSLGANLFQHSSAEAWPFRQTSLAVHLLRLMSLLMASGTVLATYLLARVLFPADRWLASGAAALVAFTPQFLFIGSSTNSDNLVNLLSTVSLIPIVRISQGQAARTRDMLALGAMVGLANLAKGSAIVLLPLALVAIILHSGRLWKTTLHNVALATIAFLTVAGPWFVRNIVQFGDPLALNWWAIAYPDVIRTSQLTLDEVLGFARASWISFWGRFGWGSILLDQRIYQALAIVTALAAIGLVIRVGRAWQSASFPRRGFALLALDVFAVGALYFAYWYSFPVTGDQGRYMFTAIGPLAILIIWGLAAYFPVKRRFLPSLLAGGGMFAFAAAVPFAVLTPAFQPFVPPAPIAPADVPQQTIRSNLVFGGDIRVYAIAAPTGPVRRGKLFSVTFYWQALKRPATDNNVTLKLVAADGHVLGSKQRRPGGRRSPTDLWQPGDIIPDTFRFAVPTDAPSGPLRIVLGWNVRGGDALLSQNGEVEETALTLTLCEESEWQ